MGLQRLLRRIEVLEDEIPPIVNLEYWYSLLETGLLEGQNRADFAQFIGDHLTDKTSLRSLDHEERMELERFAILIDQAGGWA